MAKPMLVTLPFVLLLLDYWPLQRFRQKKSTREIQADSHGPVPVVKQEATAKKKHAENMGAKTERPADSRYRWTLIRPLLWEKIPFFALTALLSVATYIAQQEEGAMKSIEAFPLSVRIGNAFVSYVIYMVKMVWPSNLAVFYPYPELLPAWQVVGAVLLLAAVTLITIRTAEKFPYLAVGWLWYVGTLVPVIGFVQVGDQARADRYTYIPLIGLFIMAAWGIPEILKKWRFRKEVLFASSALSLLCFFIVTWMQVRYWQNSITVFSHALEVTVHNSLAHYNRGNAYLKSGNYMQAIADFDRAIEINPKHAEMYYNCGLAYSNLDNQKQAIAHYDTSIEIDPRHAKAHNNRGIAYSRLGNYKQALADFHRAIAFNPRYAEACYNRAASYHNLGNQRQAFEDLKTAARLGSEDAKNFLGSQGAKL